MRRGWNQECFLRIGMSITGVCSALNPTRGADRALGVDRARALPTLPSRPNQIH